MNRETSLKMILKRMEKKLVIIDQQFIGQTFPSNWTTLINNFQSRWKKSTFERYKSQLFLGLSSRSRKISMQPNLKCNRGGVEKGLLQIQYSANVSFQPEYLLHQEAITFMILLFLGERVVFIIISVNNIINNSIMVFVQKYGH